MLGCIKFCVILVAVTVNCFIWNDNDDANDDVCSLSWQPVSLYQWSMHLIV